MKLYFAGPLFCNAEKYFNIKLTNEIEKIGYTVFLPQRDGITLDKENTGKNSNKKSKSIFELDKKEMFDSDIFLFVLDGRIPDEGACVALGMCHTYKNIINKNMILVGLQTDKRGAYLSSKLNPMIESTIDYIFENTSSLLTFLEKKIMV
ncbi:nucleoside 2-deoxyribosyltransferase domain-containing protein [Clostridium oceanicum]|uniref:Nucleoside 2-deoxyribosyltransferase n=1 Tax=Clostridium oceanicum TaxID=1543 RepID=A0ABN1JDT5_9CLOT